MNATADAQLLGVDITCTGCRRSLVETGIVECGIASYQQPIRFDGRGRIVTYGEWDAVTDTSTVTNFTCADCGQELNSRQLLWVEAVLGYGIEAEYTSSQSSVAI